MYVADIPARVVAVARRPVATCRSAPGSLPSTAIPYLLCGPEPSGAAVRACGGLGLLLLVLGVAREVLAGQLEHLDRLVQTGPARAVVPVRQGLLVRAEPHARCLVTDPVHPRHDVLELGGES